ncbi:methyltransferase [Desulfobulbus sp.]|uniref:tRNA1(Val) (adenine(37)-N6)-methyltransferase n=1 Tax=Desulfobulbus sp. TaxID=895 RepID=UPI00286F066C|nr:methyltransferase [Desulfobulbus sp.]
MSEPNLLCNAVTDDALFNGKLICRQPRNGYRFSVDAVLAAHFVNPGADRRVLDLGCGCGVIGLILCFRYPDIVVEGLELQESLADLAEANGRSNGVGSRFSVRRGDVRAIAESVSPESVDVVVCNPPYGGRKTGRLNRDSQAASARHEVQGGIEDFVRAAAFAVKNRGQVVFVYPARRCNTLLAAMQAHRLTPKRLLPVYSYSEASQACLVLVEARKNGGEQIDILAPFFIHQHGGGYSPAMRALYEASPCLPR